MTRRKKHPITVYLDPATDDTILQWLQIQTNQSEAIRLAIQQWLHTEPPPPPNGADPPLDMGELRHVVETAVESALSRYQLHPVGSSSMDDEELLTTLDGLSDALLLE